MGPKDEALLITRIDTTAALYDAGPNDMAKGLVRHQRAQTLCGPDSLMKPAQGTVRDWTGTVEALDSVGDGRGILKVRIGEHVTLGTTNNAISGQLATFKTLIAVGSPLYNAAVALKVGEKVIFSGSFFPSKNDCMEETSLTVSGGMADPDYLFRFSAIAPAE